MFQIDQEEFEVEEKSAERNVNLDIKGALEQISFLNDRYNERIRSIKKRKMNLLWTIGIYAGVGIVFIILVVVFSAVLKPPFCYYPMVLFGGLSIASFLGAIGAGWSLGVHNEMIPNQRVYTLNMEEQVCRRHLKQLEKDRNALQTFLDQETRDEADLELILKEIWSRLSEDERRADFLYGEGEKI